MTATYAPQDPVGDVSPITSDSEPDDDSIVRETRDPIEVAEHDHALLDEEEEREKLLTREKNVGVQRGFGRNHNDSQGYGRKQSSRPKTVRSRKRRGKSRSGVKDEEGELMYEMEEGGRRTDTSSEASSSSTELDKLNLQSSKESRRRRNTQCIIVAVSIIILFCALTFGAYKISNRYQNPPHLNLLSNGTSTFAPTTILISLDGFRADFLDRGITPTLRQFITQGVSPKYMYPCFPSVTFPNHFTLVTGLYPESHGIVGNTFWDPDMQADFHYTDPARSLQPEWWAAGEPLWVTAEKHNVQTAVHMWPGSEAGMGYSATYLDKFNGSEVLSRKTDRILELLDLPSIEHASPTLRRPQLIAAYVPVVDSDGHKHGPNSTEIWDTISSVDVMLHDIFIGLEERNLTNIVNVVVVSDHGMATTSIDRLIQLDDLIDLDLVEHIDGWPLYGLRPKDPIDLRGLYDRLSVEADRNPNFDVYLRDENMPERFHFSNNDRIAPLWVIPKTGWAIVHKEDFDIKKAKTKGETYAPKGLHGYDHENPLMRAIFVARGPAFPHEPNSKVEVFQNIEVYNILCDSLGIEPKPNNGTLRLPLKPIGLHAEEPSFTTDGDAKDFPPEEEPAAEVESGAISASPELNITTGGEGGSSEEESEKAAEDFWAYVKAKTKAAMAWAHKVVSGLKGSTSKPPEQNETDD